MVENYSLQWQIDHTLQNEARSVYRTGFWVAPILYSLFWIVDFFFAYEERWTFLFLRSLFLVFSAFLILYFQKPRSLLSYKIGGTLWAMVGANLITLMILLVPQSTHGYYAGLNLVALLALFFTPFDWRFVAINLGLIYLPYFALVFTLNWPHISQEVIISAAFSLGTIAIVLNQCVSNGNARIQTLLAKVGLANEVAERDKIIRKKTEESLRLAELSTHFSPQVIEAIQSQTLDLSIGTQKSEICAIIIDIVNSTENVLNLDSNSIQRAMNMFLEDAISILLKNDLTIDKFLGDGILAFCNSPFNHHDYVQRTVSSALEIRKKVNSRQAEYEKYWNGTLRIRIGIAHGPASIGFFGDGRHYKCYTAIGPVMNLAARLSSIGEPGQILVPESLSKILEATAGSKLILTNQGKKNLKGFQSQAVEVWTVDEVN